MRPGDFVRDVGPPFRSGAQRAWRFGIVVEEVELINRRFGLNREFHVLWLDGSIGKSVGVFDLEIVSESR